MSWHYNVCVSCTDWKVVLKKLKRLYVVFMAITLWVSSKISKKPEKYIFSIIYIYRFILQNVTEM